MEVLKLVFEVDQVGYLRLNIHTQLAADLVNIVVANPVVPEVKPKPKYDFSDLVGRLTWQRDAVAMQGAIRDEWLIAICQIQMRSWHCFKEILKLHNC
jgi:hypothetical protein